LEGEGYQDKAGLARLGNGWALDGGMVGAEDRAESFLLR